MAQRYEPILFARQSAESGRQLEADGARLFNFYAVNIVEENRAKVRSMLYGAPGRRLWASAVPTANAADGYVNGMIGVNSPAYGKRLVVVAKDKLIQIRPGRTHAGNMAANYVPEYTQDETVFTPADTHARTLPDGISFDSDELCRMAAGGRYVLIIKGRNLAMLDFAATLASDGGDNAGDFVTALAPTADNANAELPDEEWVDCTWIDGYFFLAARNGQVFHSRLKSKDFEQLDFATAEAQPDGLVALGRYNRRLYMMGEDTIEQWYNAGNPEGFAFSRDSSFIAEVGVAEGAVGTVVSNKHGVCFLGSDRIVYHLAGGPVPQRISTEVVESDLSDIDTSKARAFTYTEEGHVFYSLTLIDDTFDSGAKNWTFDMTNGLWHERDDHNVITSVRFMGNNIVAVGGADALAADYGLFNQSLEWGDRHFERVEREAITPMIYRHQHNITLSNISMDIPPRDGAGVTGPDGDAADSLALTWSDDNQNTWKGTSREPVLLDSLTNSVVRWWKLGQFSHGRNFRLQTSAYRRVDVLGAYALMDIETGP